MRAHPVTLALVLAAGVGWFGFPGLLWDVAWHRTIGRDSFLSPPHVLMYAGVGANGGVALWALLLGTRRHGPGDFGRIALGWGRWRWPAGFALMGLGFLLAVGGAVLDEAWHRLVGKDVNLWSPPHLVGLGGTILIAVGLALAVAGHTRYGMRPGWWPFRLLLLFFSADLIHKSMVALDHYTLDPWGRTPDFYPFLLALLLPAVFAAAAGAVGSGGATGACVIFMGEHAAILSVLAATEMRISTFSPFPVIPALIFDLIVRLPSRPRFGRAPATVLAGVAAAAVLVLQESAWMAWIVERPWESARVIAGFPAVLLAGAGSAWVGWVVGEFIRAAAQDRDAAEHFGSRQRARAALIGMALIIALGCYAAYRPSRVEPPASLAALGLAADTTFDYRDAVFWDAQLPDDWREPGVHRVYQEGIIDGRPFPVGPAWCAPDEAALASQMAAIRFGLAINGENVSLEHYPTVRRRLGDGRSCEWIGVSLTTPRPGRQELTYRVEQQGSPVESRNPTSKVATVLFVLAIKEP